VVDKTGGFWSQARSGEAIPMSLGTIDQGVPARGMST
jgi:hypothetical protein